MTVAKHTVSTSPQPTTKTGLLFDNIDLSLPHPECERATRPFSALTQAKIEIDSFCDCIDVSLSWLEPSGKELNMDSNSESHRQVPGLKEQLRASFASWTRRAWAIMDSAR